MFVPSELYNRYVIKVYLVLAGNLSQIHTQTQTLIVYLESMMKHLEQEEPKYVGWMLCKDSFICDLRTPTSVHVDTYTDTHTYYTQSKIFFWGGIVVKPSGKHVFLHEIMIRDVLNLLVLLKQYLI